MKQVAVIVLNWNGAKLLDTYLPALIAQTPRDDIRLIVADNGSTDDSRIVIQQKYPEIELLCFDRNYGFAEGYNRAIAVVKTPFICLLNSDVEVLPLWYKAPLDALQADPTVAAVQPKILSIRNRGSFEYAGAAGGMLDALGYPFCRGRVFNTVEPDAGQYDQDTPLDIFWASGACLWVRRDAYLRVGGLDTRFFAHQEEIDLCWRLQRNGYRIQVTTDSAVRHLGGGSLDMNDPNKLYLNFRNNLLMLYKNYPIRQFRKLMIIRRILDLLSVLQLLLQGRPAHAHAILRAICDYRCMRQDFAVDRVQATPPSALTSLSCPPMRLSIVWKYFVLRQRRFTDLVGR